MIVDNNSGNASKISCNCRELDSICSEISSNIPMNDSKCTGKNTKLYYKIIIF